MTFNFAYDILALNDTSEHKNPWFKYTKSEMIRLCKSPYRPTAILSSGIAFTNGILHGLMENRLIVHEYISLVGFDNAGEFYPAWSTVEQPLLAITKKALSCICETIRGKVYRNHTFLYDESFVDRESIKNML